jgi:hypothetical protein
MLGNVAEWCAPLADGTYCHRGGSAGDAALQVRCAAISVAPGESASGFLGFRVLCEVASAAPTDVAGADKFPPDAAALKFDGAGQRLELPAFLEEPGPFTIELWINPLEVSNSRNIFRTKLPDAGEAVALSFSAKDALLFSAGRGSKWASAAGRPMTAGVWQHVACVYSAAQVRLYQDGRRTGGAAVNEPLGVPGQPLWIGDCGLDSHAYRGLVREIRISRGERYTNDFQPERILATDDSTLALYHCDEAAGNEVKDASAGGKHGTLRGATWASAKTGRPLAR